MPAPVIYVDRSRIKAGREPTPRRRLAELARVVRREVPGAFSYNVYFSQNRRHMTVVHIQRDSRSLERHLTVAGRLFPGFQPLVRLERIDVYGTVSMTVVERLKAKVNLLGGKRAVHHRVVGFARFMQPTAPIHA